MKQCYFCQNEIKQIDFKNTEILQRFLDNIYRIKPRKKTGVCAGHQRELSRNIKRARQMGLIPYTQE